jgi:hypothetical protein
MADVLRPIDPPSLGLAQAPAAAALAAGGVVGVLGREAVATLAMGLAGLGMAGGRSAAIGATGALESDEAPDHLLGLATPDAVLLAGPDREGQAGIAHSAGRTDGDGLSLELRGVTEEGVVLGRDHVTAGGLITPAADLAHAARPPCGHPTRAGRLATKPSGAVGDGRASRPSSGRCRGGRGDSEESADASGFASRTPRDRVESEGPSRTNHGLSLLLRRHVAGSDGA